MIKRSRFTIVAVSVIALLAAVIVGSWGWMRSPRYLLPARSDIESVGVTHEFWAFVGHRQIPAFEIPEKHWGAILAGLTPCEPDASPSTWMVLCALRIRTKSKRNYRVDLYYLDDKGPGAFSVSLEEDFSHRQYYRGGNSDRVRDAIVAAYDEQAGKVIPSANTPHPQSRSSPGSAGRGKMVD